LTFVDRLSRHPDPRLNRGWPSAEKQCPALYAEHPRHWRVYCRRRPETAFHPARQFL